MGYWSPITEDQFIVEDFFNFEVGIRYNNYLEERDQVKDILIAAMQMDFRFRNSDRDFIEVKSEVSDAWEHYVQSFLLWKDEYTSEITGCG